MAPLAFMLVAIWSLISTRVALGQAPAGAPAPATSAAQQSTQIAATVAGALSGADPAAAKSGLGLEAEQVVEGFVTSFMHKYQLSPEERECLKTTIGKLTSDLVSAGQSLVEVWTDFMQHTNTAEAVGIVANVGIKTWDVMNIAGQGMRGCVRGEAGVMLNQTFAHLKNITYIGKRLQVNAVEITKFLGDAVLKFMAKQYNEFGAEIGEIARKILLSRNETAPKLPEGIPPSDVAQKSMEGVVAGFFVQGTSLSVKSKTDPRVNILLDLNLCFNNNQGFFRAVWNSVWHLIAMFVANAEQWKVHQASHTDYKVQFSTDWVLELTQAVATVPQALLNCNLTKETKEMFQDATHALQNISLILAMPVEQVNITQVSFLCEEAARAWEAFDFAKFGVCIGRLIRDIALSIFPQKYAVDESGWFQRLHGEQPAAVMGSSTMIVAFGCVLFLALLAVTAIQSTRRGLQARQATLYDKMSANEGQSTRTEAGDEELCAE